MHKFCKSLTATSKFLASELWQEGSSMLRVHKY